MSDEGLEPENTNGEGSENFQEDRSVDDLKAEIARLRREAAGRRVANKEKDAELDEFRKWKDSQKSELERAIEEKNRLQNDLDNLKKEKARIKAGKAAGLDESLYDRIRGDSEDEMLEDAKALAESTGKRAATSGGAAFAGSGQQPVRAPKSANDSFNEWIRNN